MATRRSEWLASIKPILDRNEAKKDAVALAKELGDILEVKVDASPENLDELAKEFNAQLKTMGKQPIVFSEKTLKGIVSQFSMAIAEGISKGVSQIDFGAQLEELNNKREKILKAQTRANQAMKAKSRMERLENFNLDTAEVIKVDGDMAKEAQQLVDILYDSADKIDKAAEKYGKSSSHYTSAVMDAQEAYNKYLRMQKTLSKMPPSQLFTIPKDVRAMYDKLGPDRGKYEADGGINVPFEETFEAEKILDAFEELSDAFEGVVDDAAKFDKMLKQVDAKIEEITRKARESGSIDDGILRGAKDGLKTLQEIEAAYKRLKVDKGMKLRQQNESHIKSALDFDPDKNSVGIKTFAKDYYDAAASGDWVEEYHALLKYVKLYESYLTSTNKTHQNKVTAKNNPFTPLYEQLKPMAENARNMLQNIINLGEGVPLVGMSGSGKDAIHDSSADVANAERIAAANQDSAEAETKAKAEAEAKAKAETEAREETEKQLQAEKEKEESLKRQRIEEEKIAKAQKKAADEAERELRAKEATAKVTAETSRYTAEMFDEYDNEYRKNIKQGQDVETAGHIDSKTGKADRFVIGTRYGVSLPGSITEDYSAFGGTKPHSDTGVHSHWTRVAAPSPLVDGVTEKGDLHTFKNRLNYQRQESIRAMEEALVLDFTQISDTALKALIDDYDVVGAQIHAQFKNMPMRDQLKQFGSLREAEEAEQVELKDAFLKLTANHPGFATYIEKPMWPESSGGENIDKAQNAVASSLADEYGRANEELKELIKNYAILTRNISKNVGGASTFKQFDDIEEKLQNVAPKLLEIPPDQWQELGQKMIDEQSIVQQKVSVTEQAVANLTAKQEELSAAQKQGDVIDDDSDVVAKENGALEDKLELLQEIAEQYGNNISQKQRDRYEELNQKDMDAGLTPKEDERYWELGEQIEEADSALEEFGETYDKILVKLANGKNIEILPDDKGLRTLSKIDEEYGESYNGVEIEDVEFVRKEMQARYENASAIKNEALAQEHLNDVRNQPSIVQDSSSVHNANAKSIMNEADAYDYLFDKAVKSLEENNRAFDDYEEMMASSGQESLDEYRERLDIYQRARNLIEEGYINQNTEWIASSSGDAEDAKLEALRGELEQKNAEIAERDNEIQRIKLDNDIAIQTINDEKQILQNDLDIANRQNAELRERASNDGDALFTAEQRANEAEERANYFAQKLAEAPDVGEKQGAINTEELKTLLSSIVYNVKIAHDDNDKQANKIALDDSTLESTLTKVFANILRPDVRQDTAERQQERWALESTLQSVKGVLDNIHTNTTKIGAVKPSNVEMIAGAALDGRLVEIKSVLESINGQIVKGGVITTRSAVKQAATTQTPPAQTQSARSNVMKSIMGDYESMGKLAAKFAEDGDLRTKATLENLKEEIKRKRASLQITMDENAKLREKYSIAFDAEKRLLDAKKQQEAIDRQNRNNSKAKESDWKKQVKDAQRATGINAATSAANAGDQTVLRAIGTEGVSKDIENKAKELSDEIKALRVLRDEIDRKGNKASAKDRDDLSKSIANVKKLKTEVDSYLKIHEKYSGEGVTDLGDASNFGAVGTDQYWNNITAAIKNTQSGKVVIKGLNADTGELTGTTRIAANTFAQWSATVDPLTGRLSMLRTGIKKTETIIEQIKRKTKEIFTYFSGSSAIFKAVNELKKGIQYVREIDLALTELKKVTDETEETYRKFLDTASKTAAKVGSTIKDVVSSTADWARLGYSMEEASKFAETTQILMNVSEFTDVSQATDTLISAVQAFGYTAETSMDVVDMLNTIGNNYAISTADLAQSLTKSSASLVAAGGDLAEAAALTATANKIIQDADSVGK